MLLLLSEPRDWLLLNLICQPLPHQERQWGMVGVNGIRDSRQGTPPPHRQVLFGGLSDWSGWVKQGSNDSWEMLWGPRDTWKMKPIPGDPHRAWSLLNTALSFCVCVFISAVKPAIFTSAHCTHLLYSWKEPDDLRKCFEKWVWMNKEHYSWEKERKQESHAVIRSFSLEEGCPGRGERRLPFGTQCSDTKEHILYTTIKATRPVGLWLKCPRDHEKSTPSSLFVTVSMHSVKFSLWVYRNITP